MKNYKEIYQEVMEIIREPSPEFVSESYTEMNEVFRDSLSELSSPVKTVEVGTWKKFNFFTGGLREKEFTVLCGPTGSGKTTLLANMAVQLIMGMTPIFVASVETGKNDFMRKMISIVSNKDTANGKPFTEEEVKEIEGICGKSFKIRNSVFSNYDSRVHHMKLLCDLYHAHVEKGVKVALIDNLNFLMEFTSAQNQNIEMDRAVHDFIIFCKKIPIHVIMVMHPRKTDNGRVESEFDIKGSSTAVQEASNVILWNRLKDDSDAPLGKTAAYCRDIKFAKVRKKGRSVGIRVIYSLENVGEMMQEVAHK